MDIKEIMVLKSKNIERYAEEMKMNVIAEKKLEEELKFTTKNLKATQNRIKKLNNCLVNNFEEWK